MKSVNGRHVLTRMLPPKDNGVLYYYSRGDDFANEIIIDPEATTRGLYNTTHPFVSASYDCRKMVRSPFEVKPREVATVISEQFYEPWSFEKSFFADYKFDTEELLAKCFETDW